MQTSRTASLSLSYAFFKSALLPIFDSSSIEDALTNYWAYIRACSPSRSPGGKVSSPQDDGGTCHLPGKGDDIEGVSTEGASAEVYRRYLEGVELGFQRSASHTKSFW